MTASASKTALVLIRGCKAQQFGNGIRARLMDRGANRHLGGLQIQLAGFVAVGENPLHKLF
jgi:hypothetical protein